MSKGAFNDFVTDFMADMWTSIIANRDKEYVIGDGVIGEFLINFEYIGEIKK